ncbi:hypothetical protein KBY77_14125 [Synechococcus sp. Cruz-7E5]|nr:hypothetical protein [Synechococcus sp. Edmonson 11F2]MCP9864260.1 hypothetical protein [Synechococcus sp. Cruz-7E5]
MACSASVVSKGSEGGVASIGYHDVMDMLLSDFRGKRANAEPSKIAASSRRTQRQIISCLGQPAGTAAQAQGSQRRRMGATGTAAG